jgi:acetyl-CoA carboxylase biotin carboxyl carrier protein
MKEKIIKKLIRLVEESDIDMLEVSSWGQKVRIIRRLDGSSSGNGDHAVFQYAAVSKTPPSAPPAPVSELPKAPPQVDDGRLMAIKSPMVGTFYAAPAPDAKPYVELGQWIDKGQVVCIVEAMKLMNEIESEVSGRIGKIMVENGKPVEFGQVLFLIDSSG